MAIEAQVNAGLSEALEEPTKQKRRSCRQKGDSLAHGLFEEYPT